LDDGETDRAAAERELFEETGIRAATFCEGFCREIAYIFRSRGQTIHKTVAFFVASTDVDEIRLSREHCGFLWMTFEESMKRLTYPTARDLLRHANAFLNSAKR
jgi:8-oxo-dGTP pyrophosphatase MutT (NUDIX family)